MSAVRPRRGDGSLVAPVPERARVQAARAGTVAAPVGVPVAVPVAAIVGLAVLLHATQWRAIAERWATDPEASHGPLVVAVACALLVARRREPIADGRARGAALLALLLLSLAGIALQSANVDAPAGLLLPASTLLAVWAALGRGAARPLFAPVAYLYLAIPIWGVTAPFFQSLTARVTGVLLAALGIPVFRDGHFLRVPAGSFEIAGGCSGVGYLQVALAIAAAFAILERLPPRRTLALLALAALLALIANWLRVTAVVALGEYTRMQSPVVADHRALGWLVFGIVLAPLALALRGWRGASAPTVRTARVPVARAVMASVAGGLAIAIWPVWLQALAPYTRSPPPTLTLPALAGWSGPEAYDGDWQPDVPGARVVAHGQYAHGAAIVDVHEYYFDTQRPGAKLHGESTRVDGGWQQAARERAAGYVQARISDGARVRLVRHWYAVRGHRTADVLQLKQWEAQSALGRARRSALVVLSAQCVPDCAAARAALDATMRAGLASLAGGTAETPAQPRVAPIP